MKYFIPLMMPFCLVSIGTPVFAQADKSCIASGQVTCLSKDDLLGALDLSVPTNSLFTLMGSTPETVITPKTGDAIAFSILPEAINAFREEESAFAVEINPGLFFLPEKIEVLQLDSKNGDLATEKLLSFFTITGAVSKSADDSRTTQYGLGLNFNYDTKSPLINNREYRDCISDNQFIINESAADFNKLVEELVSIIAKLNDSTINIAGTAAELARGSINKPSITRVLKGRNLSPTQIAILMPDLIKTAGIFDPSRIEQFNKVASTCFSRVSKWNRDVYAFGAAIFHKDISEINPMEVLMGSPEDFESVTGHGLWGSISKESPMKNSKGESSGLWTLHGRITDDVNRTRGSGDDAVIENVDARSLGTRYTHQFSATPDQSNKKARAVRGFIEAAHTEEKFSGITDKFWQVGIGAEVQLRKDVFAQFVIGDTFGSEIDRTTYLSGQLKWSFSKLSAE